ncbi:hypothetical protein PF002_g19403 [Phytophthora fragariae]|uniref:DDE-1 domain-containing protein n=1 Tax=Phytophthora fragariae TaxID=53985 RepID=A0A6A3XU48_9STRA|nr:hypothetical protein PF011_g5508 [Phytophthora fragariae]KAE9107311.1 hypothetical protein PF006_g21147 [Phytophthora fragariae]KAE9208402.1 hypothetical protein PF002_g19403 [Phytophthora fragariae]
MARRPAYTTLSLGQKEALFAKADSEPSMTQTQLAKWATDEFESPVGRSTVGGILKRKAEFVDVPEPLQQRKRHCSDNVRAADGLLLQEIAEYKAWHDNGSINGVTVRSMAWDTVGGDTAPSRGWLYRFQQRTGLWFAVRHGEGGSVDMSVVEEGKKKLKELVSSYRPQDVFYMDETSFFYRREPRGTLTTDKKEKGKKQSKLRVTVCVGTNSDGTEKLPLHFVGKAKKPRPFKNHNVFEETGATYTNTPKAWMNAVKFCEWLSDLNEAMRLQQRHVLLLVDNVSSHDEAGGQLSNVRLEKLPPNTTAVLQPMDQGIIKSLKDHCQTTKTAAHLKDFRAGKKYVPVDLLTAIKWCAQGWREVSAKTIRNCWCHTGYISKMDVRFLLN